MQSLVWGLAKELSKNFMIKVFADFVEGHKDFDEQCSFSIERVGGIKLLRKYRKAQLINEFIKDNNIFLFGNGYLRNKLIFHERLFIELKQETHSLLVTKTKN